MVKHKRGLEKSMKFIKKTLSDISIKLGIVKDLFGFLWDRKLWWLIPVVFVLLVVMGVLFFAQATGVAPFIYALF
jgi:hypothetical protein